MDIPSSKKNIINSTLLEDVKKRNQVTARRSALIDLLWKERHLNREDLIHRLETKLGPDCFGVKAREDNFYRDMRIVKQAFAAAGYRLKFSRSASAGGYYLAGEPVFHSSISRAIAGALNELDPKQIAIYKQLSPAKKFSQAVSMINFSKQAVEKTRAI